MNPFHTLNAEYCKWNRLLLSQGDVPRLILQQVQLITSEISAPCRRSLRSCTSTECSADRARLRNAPLTVPMLEREMMRGMFMANQKSSFLAMLSVLNLEVRAGNAQLIRNIFLQGCSGSEWRASIYNKLAVSMKV